ncbi:MAG: Holliday junction branch migration protein RuvA [Halanaerobiaceae bacterium]|nr:Holliday junction branch migration protein RuvA [Halanaerobiaceae bacterium]
MIAYLKGRVIWNHGNRIIMLVNGVGYQIDITDPGILTYEKEIELYIYTYVREDTLALYGFKSLEERELFTALLGVSGIGPKAAHNILSSISYERFMDAVITENISVLTQIPGVGQKTAQRLILELKNKVENLALDFNVQMRAADDSQEIYDALSSLGYSAGEIDNALSRLDIDEGLPIEEKLKLVLSYLGKER